VRRIALAVLGLVLSLSAAPAGGVGATSDGVTSDGVTSDGVTSDRAKPAVLHRVVWATASRDDPGIHLRSMDRDGSDVRASYDWPHGFTLELALDPTGRRVAFSPCCRSALPLLVVAPVLGGKAREPLEKDPARYDVVDGVAWSPNGKRLVFEGISGPAGARVVSIWTVRLNGKGLRKVLSLPIDPNGPAATLSLAWTEHGILFSDRGSLWLVRSGEASLLMRRVGEFRLSGDGSRLVMLRWKGEQGSVWMSDADGTQRRKLFDQGDPDDGVEYFDITPSYDATQLLATRRGPSFAEALVTWEVNAGPTSATVLELPDQYTMATTWN
jgi:hypothetical protein